MDMRRLAAAVAMRADQRSAAVEADSALAAAFARIRLDRAPEQRSGDQFTRCFDFPRHAVSLPASDAAC